jgi:hypothetical protein
VKRTSLAAGLAAVLALAAAAPAQDIVDWPMDIAGPPAVAGTLEFQARPAALADLLGRTQILMKDAPLPDGTRVDLVLERIQYDFSTANLYADGQPFAWDPADLTLWKGSIRGVPGSHALLKFASYGSYGHIFDGAEYINLMSFEGAQGWAHAASRLVPESVLQSVGPQSAPYNCQTDGLVGGPPLTPPNMNPQGQPFTTFGNQTLEARISVETDYQMYQNWNNLNAETNYMMALLAAMSDRYLTQINTIITYPYVMFYTTSNDPWTAQSQGALAMLNQFREAWDNGNIPNGGHLGHFMSGANLGGGIAYLDVLCNINYGFACSGNMGGNTQFPVNQGSDTWDFMVIAHETGHNFGTPHTHDYNPQIDNCAGGQHQVGTNMSYCHTCPGGMNNITTFFHPTVVNVMRNEAEQSCIPNWTGGCTDDALEDNDACNSAVALGTGVTSNLVASGADVDYYSTTVVGPTTLTVDVSFTHADGDVDVRLWDASCSTLLDSSTSNNNNESVTFDYPGQLFETYIVEVFLDGGNDCTPYSLDISHAPYDPPCQGPDDGFEDNDACNQATPIGNGANPGLYVEKADADYFEVCVDSGATLFVDALFTHADGDLGLYLYDTVGNCNSGGLLALTFALSSTNDESLAWTNTTGADQTYLISVLVMSSSASDCNTYELIITGAECSGGPGPIGSVYCDPAENNSTNQPAEISAFGSIIATDNDLTLTATQLPQNQFGYFLASETQAFIQNPGGSTGNLCLGGQLARFASQTENSGANGTFSIQVNLTAIPANPLTAAMAGDTWSFQAWYRDVVLVPTSNFTNGVEITYQ